MDAARRLHGLLRHLADSGASDLHLATGIEPRVRRHGRLEPVPDTRPLQEDELRAMLEALAPAPARAAFAESGDADFALGVPGVARFRANYFRQANGSGAVFRIVPEQIVPMEALGLPRAIAKLAELEQGLVLVTGPTGSGKSTTLAAIIDQINRSSPRHIVTIEDPVEFVHSNERSVVSHREVGLHAPSFSAALRAAVRQDPDVILVGEMRDPETIGLALEAAEMGMLVFGTLHTNGAAKTIDRVVDAFPSDEQPQVRAVLAGTLGAVVSQLLLPTRDGTGRVAAHEIVLRTTALPNIVREGKTALLSSVIQAGRAMGMQTLDDALWQLVKAGKVLPQDAYRKAADKTRFEPLLP